MIQPSDLPPSSSRLDVAAMLARAAESGMRSPTVPQMQAARALAERLMGHEVVSLETILAVQAVQAAATTVHVDADGEVTGVSGMLLLAPSAIEPIFAGEFDALDVDTRYLSRDGEIPALGYYWGIAGANKRASGAVLLYGSKVRLLFPDLSIVTRAVTPIGRHLALNKHGYVPIRHPDDDLMIKLAEPQAVAA